MVLTTATLSAVKLQIQNGDDAFFRKEKIKWFSISWFITIVSWLTHCEKFVLLKDAEGEDLLCLAGMDKVRYQDEDGKKLKSNVEFTIRSAEEVIEKYPGKFYWSPLSSSIRKLFRNKEFEEKCMQLIGTDYDTWHFVQTGIDDEHINFVNKWLSKIVTYPKWIIHYIKKLFSNSENYTKLVCSEANALLDEVGFGLDVNGSEQTPEDQAQQASHTNIYYQLKGVSAEIPKYNSKAIKWSVQ